MHRPGQLTQTATSYLYQTILVAKGFKHTLDLFQSVFALGSGTRHHSPQAVAEEGIADGVHQFRESHINLSLREFLWESCLRALFY